MHRRVLSLGGLATVVGAAVVATATLDAQSSPAAAAKAKAPAAAPKAQVKRLPWGDPDLQGVWDYKTITPLERPGAMGDRQFLTDEEVNQLETRAAKRMDEPPDPNAPPGGTVHAQYWTDPGRKVLDDRRTSLIVDPPDGRLPPTTPQAQQRIATRRAQGRDGATVDSAESRSSLERCITWGLPTAILPGLYNNNIQIVQGPGYVAITHEMVHDTRIIPLDGRPHLPSNIRQWFGDSRGHWEGDTLVVDTSNFSEKINYRGASTKLHLVERFRRVDKDTIEYQLTVDDPTTWTQPWTAAFPMRPSEGLLYEYACHEGNYGLMNMLEVARDAEKVK